MISSANIWYFLRISAVSMVLLSAPAWAQGGGLAAGEDAVQTVEADLSETGEVAYMDGEETHPALKIMPDKSTIVRLERDAGSVIIGNETHLNILLDNPRTLVVSGRSPGATYFTILDNDRRVIMQRHVLVAAPEDRYIRIRRSCVGAGCQPTSVYYCPDLCHEVAVDGATAASGQSSVMGGGSVTFSAGSATGGGTAPSVTISSDGPTPQ